MFGKTDPETTGKAVSIGLGITTRQQNFPRYQGSYCNSRSHDESSKEGCESTGDDATRFKAALTAAKAIKRTEKENIIKSKQSKKQKRV